MIPKVYLDGLFRYTPRRTKIKKMIVYWWKRYRANRKDEYAQTKLIHWINVLRRIRLEQRL